MDGASEFMADLESGCQKSGIRLFVFLPRSPKRKGHVERAQRIRTEEFCEIFDGEMDIPTLNRALLTWERICDTFQPLLPPFRLTST